MEAEGEEKYDGRSNNHSQRDRKVLCCWLDAGGKGQKPRDAGSQPTAGKREEMDSPVDLPEGTQTCHHDFSSVRLILKL